jgi:uncharacterized protein YjiS (DUF1127 family)
MEIGAMDLLHRLGQSLAAKFSEQKTVQRLKRLDDRNLADLGLSREDIRPVARLASRVAPEGIPLTAIIARVRAGEGARSSLANRLYGSLALAAARYSANEAQTLAYRTSDLDRYVEEAHRLRAETMARFWQSVGQQFAATDLGKRFTLNRLRRSEIARITGELESYTPQQLMADLRLTRSEIDGIAADGAARTVDAFVRVHPDYRGVAGWEGRRLGISHARG